MSSNTTTPSSDNTMLRNQCSTSLLSEYFLNAYQTQQQQKHETSAELLDKSHLQRLNTILSNVPFVNLQQSCGNLVERQQQQHQQTTKKPEKVQEVTLVKEPQPAAISSSSSTASMPAAATQNNPIRYNTDKSTQIVIHVCDEAKQLKQDFYCPRDLLVAEMKYFSHNLKSTANAQQQNDNNDNLVYKRSCLDDIDISVHCDINIFEWLMRYVKRNHKYLIDNNEQEDTSEPKLEVQNCVSILLSSDFLMMGDLVDKCVVFIADQLPHVLSMPCIMTCIGESILSRLAACVPVAPRLDEVYDRRDKLKTKLFQRKLEFMFDLEKFKSQFDSSDILKQWRDSSPENYQNFLYECENNASALFRCKLCSRLMTKRQSLHLTCQLGMLDLRGDFVYMHVPDDRFDVTALLRLVKERVRTWSATYWFVWALVKPLVKCSRCHEWFRLCDWTRCRLHESSTFCALHDDASKKKNTTVINNNACSCVLTDHLIDMETTKEFYEESCTNVNNVFEYIQYVLDNFERHKDLICHGKSEPLNSHHQKQQQQQANEEKTAEQPTKQYSMSFCSLLENALQTPQQQTILAPNVIGKKHRHLFMHQQPTVSNYFIDSIVGKHICFLNKSLLSLLKLAMPNVVVPQQQQQLTIDSPSTSQVVTYTNPLMANLASFSNTSTPPPPPPPPLPSLTQQITSHDLKSYLNVVSFLDAQNAFNSLAVFNFYRTENKMRWDLNKPIRLNQDNQREDDLKRFREITNYLIRAGRMTSTMGSAAAVVSHKHHHHEHKSDKHYPGGIYCRIEHDWRQKQT